MCVICGGVCGPTCMASTDAIASLAGFIWLFVTIRARRLFNFLRRRWFSFPAHNG